MPLSNHHDGDVAARVFGGVVEHCAVMLYPTVSNERPRTNTEYPVRKYSVPGQEFEHREGIPQTLFPVREQEGTQIFEDLHELSRALNIEEVAFTGHGRGLSPRDPSNHALEGTHPHEELRPHRSHKERHHGTHIDLWAATVERALQL